jgi:putative NIF3 family GTP cyclohydrolase 1 type 2
VAYEIYELQNTHQNVGLGMVGEFETPMEEHDFLALVKKKMQADGIRHSALTGKQIKKSGSSGRFQVMLKNAIMAGADAFLTLI